MQVSLGPRHYIERVPQSVWIGLHLGNEWEDITITPFPITKKIGEAACVAQQLRGVMSSPVLLFLKYVQASRQGRRHVATDSRVEVDEAFSTRVIKADAVNIFVMLAGWN